MWICEFSGAEKRKKDTGDVQVFFIRKHRISYYIFLYLWQFVKRMNFFEGARKLQKLNTRVLRKKNLLLNKSKL